VKRKGRSTLNGDELKMKVNYSLWRPFDVDSSVEGTWNIERETEIEWRRDNAVFSLSFLFFNFHHAEEKRWIESPDRDPLHLPTARWTLPAVIADIILHVHRVSLFPSENRCIITRLLICVVSALLRDYHTELEHFYSKSKGSLDPFGSR